MRQLLPGAIDYDLGDACVRAEPKRYAGVQRPGLGKRAVDPETIADHDQCGVHGRAESTTA
jgi:hypothetical protein